MKDAMTELETLKLKIEYMENRIMELELRLQNAFTYIEILINEKKEKK